MIEIDPPMLIREPSPTPAGGASIRGAAPQRVSGRLCEHVSRYRGKMLRPTLTLLSGIAAARGDASILERDALVRLAAVVEMIHMATLVHDDVLDEADDRRGGRTVNRLRGNETAVMLGDYLISNAFHLAATIGDADLTVKLGEITNTLCEELIQLHHREDLGPTSRPTSRSSDGRPRSWSAVWATPARRRRRRGDLRVLGRFGEELGIAFQVRDDILDPTATPIASARPSTGPRQGQADASGDPAAGHRTLGARTGGKFESRDGTLLLELLRESDGMERVDSPASGSRRGSPPSTAWIWAGPSPCSATSLRP